MKKGYSGQKGIKKGHFGGKIWTKHRHIDMAPNKKGDKKIQYNFVIVMSPKN